MRGLAYDAMEEASPDDRPRRRWPRALAAVVVLAALSPLMLEGMSLCLGGWREVFGVSTSVSTPILDSVRDEVDDLRVQFRVQVEPWFQRVPWDPKMVLPAAAVVMAGSMLLLRR
ncbi:hypothetical protein OJF2_28360 [Aquisphaera giovannonii]|uniref:Uncharacterized protein n=1 Tax=Aquisphaera giovannonii TaxID=406548 RepID=A0A5B9W2W7_9BACT|nr:hypothetical protein [Aquisphaera giovannonii]QEH34300.1 hypothetical protein OJF2_28360 [Aquisphaera giovannonii]